MADLDLTPEMEAPRATGVTPTTKLIFEEPEDAGPALDLDEDFGGALEDFADAARAAGPESSLPAEEEPSLSVDPFDLDFAAGDADAVAEESPMLDAAAFGEASREDELDVAPALEAVELDEDAGFEIAEAELSPLGAGDADELDDAFVELLEE